MQVNLNFLDEIFHRLFKHYYCPSISREMKALIKCNFKCKNNAHEKKLEIK